MTRMPNDWVSRGPAETRRAAEHCPEGDVFEWVLRKSLPEPGARREEHLRPLTAQIVEAVR